MKDRMNLQTRCPNCGSSATRSRSAVYQSGTATYSGRSSSSGISFNLFKRRRPRLWFGSGSHSGTRQNLMARSAGPMPFLPSLYVIIILFLIYGAENSRIIIGALILWIIVSFYYNNTRYVNEWICTKCGCFFDPKIHFENNIASKRNKITNELNRLSYQIYYPAKEVDRITSIQRANVLLRELERLGENETIKNYDEMKADFSLLNSFKPILLLLDKADSCLLRQDKKNEIKSLLEALHLLIKMKASRKKFDSFGFISELTKKKWTVNYLKRRLIEAGYTPKAK
jgi:hypothetical protein